MSFILNFEIVVEIDNDIPLLTISCFPYLSWPAWVLYNIDLNFL